MIAEKIEKIEKLEEEKKHNLVQKTFSKLGSSLKPSDTFLERYYNFWNWVFQYKRFIKPQEVDFEKPHWNVFKPHLASFSYILIEGLLNSFLYSVAPLVIGYAISQRDLNLLILLILGYIGTSFFDFLAEYLKQIVLNNIDISIQTSAAKFFLAIDPLNYATKSTGEILNKVTRSTASAKSLLNTSAWTLFAFGGFGTLIGSAAYTDSRLFWLSASSFGACGIFYGLARFPFYPVFLKKNIAKEDGFFAVLNETISQLAFIRSIFASPEQHRRIQKMSLGKAVVASNEVAYTTLAGNLSNIILQLAKIPIAIVLFERVQAGTMSSEVALGFFTIYWSNTWTTGVLAHNFQQILADWAKMADLWKYARSFPKAGFRVFDEEIPAPLVLK